jgi:two-component system OmpR family sensor kinase
VHARPSLNRLPIRLRLTLVFTGVMAVVLAAVGIFMHLHLESGLDTSINSSLRGRADDLTTLARQVDPRRQPPLDGVAQILDTHGHVIDGEPRALLSPREVRLARTQEYRVTRGETMRLLARPVQAQGRAYIAVVGESLEQREHALTTATGALLIGGSLALLLAAVAAYGLAASALRPVESMRRRARTISADRPDARLPLPPADDEIHRLGDTLNEMLERLEAGLVRERAFVADASHELRTPLAILKMELELAMLHGSTREELEAALRSAAEETDRLARLADDLLVLARADEGVLPVRLEPLDARALLEGVSRRFATPAGRPLEVDVPAGLTVDGDELRLEQALGNLVDNALRHGGGVVRLAAIKANGTVELHVADEGDGFPPELLPRAFERFARADAARSRRGAGLGLSIVHAIARAHGGEAHAANREHGADVWLEVPSV